MPYAIEEIFYTLQDERSQAGRAAVFGHFILRTTDGPDQAADTEAAVRLCRASPRRRLGPLTHNLGSA